MSEQHLDTRDPVGSRCALRELEEETGINRSCIDMDLDSPISCIQYVNEKNLFKTVVNVTLFPAYASEEIPIQ